MKPHERVEWQAIRAEERKNRLERKKRMAAALDPELVAGAERVRQALADKDFAASLGFGPSRHIVKVTSVKASDKGTVEGIANAVLKDTPRYPHTLAFQSYITIEVMVGREVYELEQEIERKGEWGTLIVPDANGVLREIGKLEQNKPLANDSLDYRDPYGITGDAA